MKLVTTITMMLSVSMAISAGRVQHHYYGQSFYTKFTKFLAQNPNYQPTQEFSSALRNSLYRILSGKHQVMSRSFDVIGSCTNRSACYSQKEYGYSEARRVVYLKLHAKVDKNGRPYFKDVYCERNVAFRTNKQGQAQMPNHTDYNIEHSWPQSRFSGRGSKGMQKSDLHHLYPTDSRFNSTRGNMLFGEVEDSMIGGDESCPSKMGYDRGNKRVFEPPREHKGNLARSLFYFSVRYQIRIPDSEERVLRAWHQADPVDAEEQLRNNLVYKYQKNRNPFVDYPYLTRYIQNF
jgi:endonuclease I